MKKKIISPTKYICHNKQLKNLHKFIPMNINQQIITLNIQKTPDLDIFFRVFFFFLIFKVKITVSDKVYASFSLL